MVDWGCETERREAKPRFSCGRTDKAGGEETKDLNGIQYVVSSRIWYVCGWVGRGLSGFHYLKRVAEGKGKC